MRPQSFQQQIPPYQQLQNQNQNQQSWNQNQTYQQMIPPQHFQQNQPQRQRNALNNQQFDYDHVQVIKVKYPRQQIPETAEENMELGGVYQSFVYKLGECLGCCRTYIPCCCCADYPYKQIDQSFVGLYERFGKYAKTVGSGLQYFNPLTDQIRIIDMKTSILDLPKQTTITKDNIEVSVDTAVYYNVREPRKTYYSLQKLPDCVRQLTFATLRSVIGQYVLQDLLQKRETVTLQMGKFVARHVKQWGIEITNILIKDIIVNRQLQDALSSTAKQRKLAQSKILSAKADVDSAKLMRQTADILSSKAAMQIRYLDTMKSIASGKNVKIVLIGQEQD